MKINKYKWPMTLGIIGSVYAVVVGFVIAFIETGGKVPGYNTVGYGNMWLLISIMAIISPVIGLLGASLIAYTPRVSGVLLLFSVIEYFVVCILIGIPSTIPYLLIGGIGTLFMFMSSMMALVYPMLEFKDWTLYQTVNTKNTTKPYYQRERETE